MSPDRYAPYKEIDCDGKAKKLMGLLLRYIETAGKEHPFWDKFVQRLSLAEAAQAESGQSGCELFLIHTYINNIYELFEEYGDSEALDLLQQIELECC